MKKLFVITMLGLASIAGSSLKAQVNINVNIGSQPQWGPAGYNHVDYYYLPDIESYYYVPARQFIYLERGHWIFASSLPSRYHGYNLYNGYKVVINSPKPYLSYKQHKVKYAKYKKWNKKQVTLRENRSRGPYKVKNMPDRKYYGSEKKSHKEKNHGNGKGKGNNGKH